MYVVGFEILGKECNVAVAIENLFGLIMALDYSPDVKYWQIMGHQPESFGFAPGHEWNKHL